MLTNSLYISQKVSLGSIAISYSVRTSAVVLVDPRICQALTCSRSSQPTSSSKPVSPTTSTSTATSHIVTAASTKQSLTEEASTEKPLYDSKATIEMNLAKMRAAAFYIRGACLFADVDRWREHYSKRDLDYTLYPLFLRGSATQVCDQLYSVESKHRSWTEALWDTLVSNARGQHRIRWR